MDDKYARTLIDRARRIEIYRRLNPCNVAMADNCPSAAEALFNYLNERAGRAYCNDVTESFTENPEVHYHAHRGLAPYCRESSTRASRQLRYVGKRTRG